MKIKFTKDFANNWKAGDVVNVKHIGQGEVLVDNVVKIDLKLLLKHCVVLLGQEELEQIPLNNIQKQQTYEKQIIKDWLSTFNTDSATACFTAVQELKKKI